MNHDDLRQSLIYKRALQTPDVMGRIPAGYAGSRWRNYDNRKVEEACLRLDHLIRNALDHDLLRYRSEFLTERHVEAIKAFVRYIESTLPRMQVTQQTRNEIMARIEFCKRIAAESDKERAEFNEPPLSADMFELRVRHLQGSMDQLVYGSPFFNFYAGTTYIGDVLDRRLNEYHDQMRRFWH